MGAPGYYTERGRRFYSVAKYLSGGEVPLRLQGLSEPYVRNLDPRDPGRGASRWTPRRDPRDPLAGYRSGPRNKFPNARCSRCYRAY
jgi:hypothetical protein